MATTEYVCLLFSSASHEAGSVSEPDKPYEPHRPPSISRLTLSAALVTVHEIVTDGGDPSNGMPGAGHAAAADAEKLVMI